MTSALSTHYFLGANSPSGFYSLYDWLIDPETAEEVFILKGGPGCGKSSFMRYIAAKIIDKGVNVEYIHCSSDPDSLDGIVLKELKTAYVDGTHPHVVEPKYAGAVESYVNLGEFYDIDVLKEKKEEILAATKEYKQGYSSAYRCLSAAKSLLDDQYSILLAAMDFKRLERRTRGICARELKRKGRHPSGRLTKRFLSSISPKGHRCDFTSVKVTCDRIYELKSAYRLSGLMMSEFLNTALENGYDVTACYSPLYPEGSPEHLVIPELKLAFISSSDHAVFDGSPYRRVLLDNLLDKARLRPQLPRLKYTRKMAKSLIDEATATFNSIFIAHTALENIYNPHVDFDKVYELAEAHSARLIERCE